MKSRKLTEEILDHLAHDDPKAIRSRRDLRRINCFMGNEPWILENIPRSTSSITEIGAGDGMLMTRISRHFLKISLTARDLAPRPSNLPQQVEWIRGDIFKIEPSRCGGTLIANLILHHFNEEQLRLLAPWIRSFDTLIFSEPLRSHIPQFMGKLAYPFISPVTRHDMRVSIEAGFRIGELAEIIGLTEKEFVIHESSTWRGSLRMVASRT